MLNLTPHAIVLQGADGTLTTLPPSGTVARVSVTEQVTGEYMGLPVVSRVAGTAQGLPEEGTPCVVSAMVLAAVPGRKMVFAPDSGPTAIRNTAGQVTAVTRLVAA